MCVDRSGEKQSLSVHSALGRRCRRALANRAAADGVFHLANQTDLAFGVALGLLNLCLQFLKVKEYVGTGLYGTETER